MNLTKRFLYILMINGGKKWQTDLDSETELLKTLLERIKSIEVQ